MRTEPFRALRKRERGGRAQWFAIVRLDDGEKEVSLFPRRDRRARHPDQEEDPKLRAAWEKVRDGKVPTHREAKLRARAVEREVLCLSPGAPRTIAELFERVLDEDSGVLRGGRKTLSPRTVFEKRRVFRRFAEAFPRLRLDQLSPSHVARWRKQWSHLSASSMRYQLRYLDRAFRIAVKRRWLPRNPIDPDTIPGVASRAERADKARERVLTELELAALLEHSRRHADASTHAAIVFLAETGVRVGEACLEVHRGKTISRGLQWEDVDLDEHRAKVRGKSGFRMVGLTPAAEDALDALLVSQEIPGSNLSIVEGPVFRNKAGTPMRDKTLRERLRKLSEAALDRRVTPHMLRHSWTTHALRRNLAPIHVQNQCGHASIATTMLYAHDSEEARIAAIRSSVCPHSAHESSFDSGSAG